MVPFSIQIADAASLQGRFCIEVCVVKRVAYISDMHAFLPEETRLFARDLVTRFFSKQNVHPVAETGVAIMVQTCGLHASIQIQLIRSSSFTVPIL
jgi:hypothetical protein